MRRKECIKLPTRQGRKLSIWVKDFTGRAKRSATLSGKFLASVTPRNLTKMMSCFHPREAKGTSVARLHLMTMMLQIQ